MPKLRLILLFSLIYTPLFCQQVLEKVPMVLVDDIIFVDLTINGSPEPLHFMFDTGAGITVLDSAIAAKLNITSTNQIPIGTAGKVIQAPLSSPHRITLGTALVVNNITLAIIDLSHLDQYLKTPVDGIIGSDLLQNFVVETNIDAREMRFYSSSGYTYSGPGQQHALIGLEAGHIGLPVVIVPGRKSEPITMILKVDSAANNYFTFHQAAVEQYPLLNPRKKYTSKQGFGAESTISYNLGGKIATASFNGKTWKNIPVVYEVDPLNSTSKREADGLIGQAVLLDFNIVYHLEAGVAYFEQRE